MENPSLQIGDNNWAVKDGSILGYNIIQDNYLPQPIDFTRASSATRVNEQGLIETPSFLGSELIINGDFATVSNWNTSSASYSVSGNLANVINLGVIGGINQTFTTVIGKTYKATFTAFNGDVNATIQIGYVPNGGQYYQNIGFSGTTEVSFIAVGTSVSISLRVNSSVVGANCNFSNVSVKEVITNNIPRIDYTGGGFGKLLLEPQRTNLLLYSELFNNAYWSSIGITITPNSTTSPDGTLNAQKLTSTSYNSVRRILSVTTSTIYTQSFYVKKDTSNESWVQLLFAGGTNIQYGYRINWTSFTISKISGAYADPTSVSFTSVGNGWYRFEMAASSTNNTSVTYAILPDSSATSSIFAWGAQLELGSYPTSYIPTTTTTVTRVQDSAIKTGISSLIGQTEGTILLEIPQFIAQPLGTFGAILSVYTSSSDRIGFICVNSTQINIYIYAGGVLQLSFIFTPSNGVNKMALGYANNDAVVVVNGNVLTTDTSIVVPPSSAIALNNYGFSALAANTSINQVQLFTTRLSNAELETLTTI